MLMIVNSDIETLNERIAILEKKVNKFSEILQNFGLDLIHSIGSIKHEMTTLSKKTEKIEGSIIELKGMKTHLQETIKNQRKWYETMEDINLQLKSLNQKYQVNSSLYPKKKTEYSKLDETPQDVLEQLNSNIESAKTVHDLHQYLKKAKERIFIITGGHKILLELRAYEQKAMRDSNIQFEQFKATLLEKVKEWRGFF